MIDAIMSHIRCYFSFTIASWSRRAASRSSVFFFSFVERKSSSIIIGHDFLKFNWNFRLLGVGSKQASKGNWIVIYGHSRITHNRKSYLELNSWEACGDVERQWRDTRFPFNILSFWTKKRDASWGVIWLPLCSPFFFCFCWRLHLIHNDVPPANFTKCI